MAVIQDLGARKGLFVTENATVAGNAAIQQNITVTNTATFSNTLTVTGAATFSNTLSTTGFANVGGSLQVAGAGSFGTGNVTFDTDTLIIDATNDRVGVNTALGQTVAFMVTGDANVSGTFTAANIVATNITTTALTVTTGNSTFDSGVLFVDTTNNRVGINNTTPDASLTVTGQANVSGSVIIGGSLTAVLSSAFSDTLGVTGAATFSNTIAVTGATTLSNTLGVTGAATFSNTIVVTRAATFSNTVGVTGILTATGGVVGALNGIANQCARSIVNGTYITGGAALTSDITISVDATPNSTASKVVARDSSRNFSANTITADLYGTALSSNNLLYAGSSRVATDLLVGLTIVARDGNGSFAANVMTGTATAARYADLAEKYLADKTYGPGTVLSVGGELEVTAATPEIAHSILGVVSTNPAHLMNSDLINGTIVALKGRVPVLVLGEVRKGDRLTISDQSGIANANNDKNAWSFAISLEASVDKNTKLVEAVIL